MSADVRVLRRTTNVVLAWVLSYGLFIMFVVVDPLAVYSKWEDGGQGFNGVFLGFFAVLFSVSVGGFAIFARPRVEIRGEGLTIRNVVHDVWIPWSQLQSVDASTGTYLRVQAEDRWFAVLGIERWNMEVFADRPGMAGQLAEIIEEDHSSVSNLAPDGVVVYSRKIEKAEIALLVVWVLYLVLAVGRNLLLLF